MAGTRWPGCSGNRYLVASLVRGSFGGASGWYAECRSQPWEIDACSPTSKDTTIVSGSIPPSVISPPNRQSAKPLNPVSAKSEEGHYQRPVDQWAARAIGSDPPEGRKVLQLGKGDYGVMQTGRNRGLENPRRCQSTKLANVNGINPRISSGPAALGAAHKDPMRACGGNSSVSAAHTTLKDIGDDAGSWRTSHPYHA